MIVKLHVIFGKHHFKLYLVPPIFVSLCLRQCHQLPAATHSTASLSLCSEGQYSPSPQWRSSYPHPAAVLLSHNHLVFAQNCQLLPPYHLLLVQNSANEDRHWRPESDLIYCFTPACDGAMSGQPGVSLKVEMRSV